LKISQLLEIASAKILLCLLEKEEMRHVDLLNEVRSRSTLSLSLKDLQAEGLVRRRVLDTQPVQTFYGLTKKGILVAQKLQELQSIMSS
jgi:DNA-binding HxlR family transcriptional regulator